MRLVCGMACISVPFVGKRAAAPFPGAPGTFPDGQNAPKSCFFPRCAMIRRAHLQRLCPQGKQRRIHTPAASLARRATQRRKEIPFSSPCDRMARDGGRTTDLTRSSLGGRCAPCAAGASSAAPGEAAPGEAAPGEAAPGEAAPGEVIPVNPTPGEPQLPEAQPPENLNPPGFPKLGSPATCIAFPPASSMGY